VKAKANKPKTNWIIDAVLFLGFVLTFFLDVTGLALHQLLGVFVGLLAAYHLVVHWAWVKAVSRRLFKCGCGKARWNYVVDAGVLLSMALIILTGLVMSTWLELPLPNYFRWRQAHVWVSIATAALVTLKIAMHWRWIVNVARKHILPGLSATGQPALAPVPVLAEPRILNRRTFLVLMGGVGGVGVAGALAVRKLVGAQMMSEAAGALTLSETVGEQSVSDVRDNVLAEAPTATVEPTPTPDAQPSAPRGRGRRGGTARVESAAKTQSAVEPTRSPLEDAPSTVPEPEAEPIVTAPPAPTPVVVEDCSVRCPRACSYPGSCRKYVDDNNNGKCDLGECL